MEIEQRSIESINPYPKNAKEHKRKQIEKIASSIKEFGFNQPIVVDKEGVIVVGHGRYMAAMSLNMTEVPVLEIDLTEEQAKSYRLADNKLNESDWDMGLVLEELKSISIDMINLTGFDSDLVIEPEDKDDEVPTIPKEAISKLGDIYQLGKHRVVCGDSTKIEDVYKLANDKRMDMFFTDPPYGINYEGGSKKREKLDNDNIDVYPFYKEVFKNAFTVSKRGATAYVWHASTETHNAIQAFIDSGWEYKQYIIWNKDNSTFGRQDFHWKHEPCIYGWASGGPHKWYGDRKQTTVWDVKRPSKSDEHSTMKPVELCVKGLTFSSKTDDIVLDLFLGSGSTLIASEKTKRICYGMELDPKYVDVIVKRYIDYTNNNTIIKNGKEIQWQV